MSDKKRYVLIMTVSVLMNFFLAELCRLLSLPFWLDTTGTAFAALALEPTAGLIVGLVNNFYQGLFEYGASSLIYYGLSACMALVVGVMMRKKQISFWKRLFITFLVASVLQGTLSVVLTFWQSGIDLVHPWEIRFNEMFLSVGADAYFSAGIAIALVKVIDVIVTLMLVCLFYRLLPKSMKAD